LYPHPIHLRGAWDSEVGGEGASPHGCIRYRRTFHRPSNLDPHERLWLVWEGAAAGGQMACNGQILGPLAGTRTAYEITPLLATQNQVAIEFESSSAPLGDVRLEVREQQYLDQWRLWLQRTERGLQLELQGWVAGEPYDGALELVVRGPEEEWMYAPVTVGSVVSLTAMIPGTSDLPGQVEAEIRLIRGGVRVWEERKRLTVPGSGK
jgi:hypothetical protein